MTSFMAIILLFCTVLLAQYPSGAEILKKIDENMSSTNRIFTAKMIIYGSRGSRTIESRSWSVGEEKSFTEYLAPAREKGTKMLKLAKQLWLYDPGTDRTIQISGHMLRQSVLGSDLSYEDLMEDAKLVNRYDATVIGEETIDERPCWVLELIATTKDVAYHMRKLWVDQQRQIPLKEELYARSGKLLKKMELKDITRIQNRWFPKRILFKDVLKTGDGTEFLIETIQFDQDIPEHIFSKAALRK